MDLDSLNFFIILTIYKSVKQKKRVTTWDISKAYNWPDKEEGLKKWGHDGYYTRKSNMIGARLGKMNHEGLVDIEKDLSKRNKYLIRGDRVLLCKHKFRRKYFMSLQIKDKNNKWSIFQL